MLSLGEDWPRGKLFKTMPAPTFTGKYAKDGKTIREAARASVGHRCIRCGHPFQCGVTKLVEKVWSDCDSQCVHQGTIRTFYKGIWSDPYQAACPVGEITGGQPIQASSRILTVHHFDGNKENDRWFNLLPLCQRCHLQVQTKVNPEIPFLFEHSDWLKPYVAGYYALKYQGRDLTREQVMAELETLLALERKA
jgi:hypothetical protein